MTTSAYPRAYVLWKFNSKRRPVATNDQSSGDRSRPSFHGSRQSGAIDGRLNCLFSIVAPMHAPLWMKCPPLLTHILHSFQRCVFEQHHRQFSSWTTLSTLGFHRPSGTVRCWFSFMCLLTRTPPLISVCIAAVKSFGFEAPPHIGLGMKVILGVLLPSPGHTPQCYNHPDNAAPYLQPPSPWGARF